MSRKILCALLGNESNLSSMFAEQCKEFDGTKDKIEYMLASDLSDTVSPDYDVIISKCIDKSSQHGLESCIYFLRKLKPNGKIIIHDPYTTDLVVKLGASGFIKMNVRNNNPAEFEVEAFKPNFEYGNNGGNINELLGQDFSQDNDLIDPDTLLDDEDYSKPQQASLKVCSTTGKRKACKDCSCGLAEELAAENTAGQSQKSEPKSSCGSCYLGDAFRCASCPYLGMPAFKPGEKVELNLADDI